MDSIKLKRCVCTLSKDGKLRCEFLVSNKFAKQFGMYCYENRLISCSVLIVSFVFLLVVVYYVLPFLLLLS